MQGQRPCLPSHTGISEHGKHSKRSLNAAGVFSLDTRYPKTTPTLPPHSDSPTSVSTDEPIRRTRGILATRKENEKRPAAYESSPVRVVACIHVTRVECRERWLLQRKGRSGLLRPLRVNSHLFGSTTTAVAPSPLTIHHPPCFAISAAPPRRQSKCLP